MESIQTMIRDNDHDVKRSRNHGELRQKCKDGKKLNNGGMLIEYWLTDYADSLLYM